jgi:hypothetical protein
METITFQKILLIKITMKKLLITTFTLSLLITPITKVDASFKDVSSSHSNLDAINYVQSEGIVNGYSDGTYKPDQTINRAEFTKIIIGSKYSTDEIYACIPNEVFSDIAPFEVPWIYQYSCMARNEGIINGYEDGTFKPFQKISFIEAAKIISNTFGYETAQDNVWYRPFVEKLATEKAIPTSIDSFHKNITRGEMAEMVYRLMANVTDKDTRNYEELVPKDTQAKYVNEEYGFAFSTFGINLSKETFDHDKKPTVSFKGNNIEFNIELLLGESISLDDYHYRDFPLTNTGVLGSELAHIVEANDYCSGPGCTKTSFIAYTAKHNDTFYTLNFFGDTILSPLEKNILESFEFIDTENNWTTYKNEDLGLSFKYPKKHNGYSISTIEHGDIVFLDSSFFIHNQIINVIDSDKVDYDKVKGLSFAFIIKKVTNENKIDEFIKKRYGNGCSFGSLKPSNETEIYDVQFANYEIDFENPNSCGVNYMTHMKYNPTLQKIISWSTGQAYTFNSIDDEKINKSVEFINTEYSNIYFVKPLTDDILGRTS